MKQYLRAWLSTALTVTFIVIPSPAEGQAAAPPVPGFAGIWLTELLGLNGKPLRLVLQIDGEPGSTWTAVAASPDQGFGKIPVADLELAEEQVRLRIPLLAASFSGKLVPGAQEIDGFLAVSGFPRPLRFRRIAEMPPLVVRPQTPRPPFPYRVEEFSVESSAGGVRLACSLTLPPEPAPHPAAILLSVAGPDDRDQSFAEHRSFLVLANALTRRGFAVLRCDDRGVGGSGGVYLQSTYDDFAADAWSAFQLLASRPEIDRARIGFIGHSQGTAIAALAASRHPEVAFLVLLGGLGLPTAEALEGQAVALVEARRGGAEEVAKTRALVRKITGLIQENVPLDTLRRELRVLAEAGQLRQGALILGAGDDVESQVSLYSSPWYLSQFTYRPSEVFPKVRCPVLALSGSLDPILPAAPNLLGIHRELAAGGNPDVTIVQLPGLNHLLQTARTGLPIEYSSLDETFSPRALAVITEWLAARFPEP